jgi:hypothetical protein
MMLIVKGEIEEAKKGKNKTPKPREFPKKSR